jgi:hypothetical protein
LSNTSPYVRADVVSFDPSYLPSLCKQNKEQNKSLLSLILFSKVQSMKFGGSRYLCTVDVLCLSRCRPTHLGAPPSFWRLLDRVQLDQNKTNLKMLTGNRLTVCTSGGAALDKYVIVVCCCCCLLFVVCCLLFVVVVVLLLFVIFLYLLFSSFLVFLSCFLYLLFCCLFFCCLVYYCFSMCFPRCTRVSLIKKLGVQIVNLYGSRETGGIARDGDVYVGVRCLVAKDKQLAKNGKGEVVCLFVCLLFVCLFLL